MSNILKVTTPLTGYENNTIRPNANQQAQDISNVQAPVAPDKVVKPDARNDAGTDAQAQMRLNYESNFSNFVQLLRDTPDSVEELAQLLREQLGAFSKADLSGQGTGVLTEFFSRIGVEEKNMPGYFKEQVETSLRFQGPFFNLVRQTFNETSSVELKAGILDLLRRYADMASGDHILSTIENALKECQERMFPGPASELAALAQELKAQNSKPGVELPKGQAAQEADAKGGGLNSGAKGAEKSGEPAQGAGASSSNGTGRAGAARDPGSSSQTAAAKGDTSENAAILKEKIIPFLNRYISQTHDRGSLRNIAVQMAYQLSRYENGDMEGIKNAYRHLMEFQDFRSTFEDISPEMLSDILRKAADDSEQEAAVKDFVKMLSEEMKGNGTAERKQALHNYVQNTLLNESVYMPVLHLTLPMVVDGRMIYSELWVDPDADNSAGADMDERAIKMLVKFDIEDVGFFDLFFVYQGGRMDLQLDYPDELSGFDRQIRDGVAQILSENSIRVENFVTGSSAESIPLEEAFPKLVERREGINVRV